MKDSNIALAGFLTVLVIAACSALYNVWATTQMDAMYSECLKSNQAMMDKYLARLDKTNDRVVVTTPSLPSCYRR